MLNDLTFWALITLIIFVLAALSIFKAIMETRTPQGAIAWVLSLFYMPFITLPIYWIFGRNKFSGYETSYKVYSDSTFSRFRDELFEYLKTNNIREEVFIGHDNGMFDGFSARFVGRNDVELLINGEAAYGRMFEAIKLAKHYVLVQFYIVRDDSINHQLKDLLITKAKEGVRCYYTFDPVGSEKVNSITNELAAAGVEVAPFVTTRGWGNWLQMNFRNHRKIVVVDGEVAFTGGINMGIEYLGLDPAYGFYRDTNVRLVGPAVIFLQYIFLRDWNFASVRSIENLLWRPLLPEKTGEEVAIISTSPASINEYGTLFFLHLINNAKKRIWMCNPYFVPDEQFVSALQLAAMRGVEIKVLTPKINNSKLAQHGFFFFVEAFRNFPNIEMYHYTKGFMHQKVALIDDDLSLIGTHNFDNRSFRLNFENSALIRGRQTNAAVEAMIQHDFETSEMIPKDAYQKFSYWQKLRVRAISLLFPIV